MSEDYSIEVCGRLSEQFEQLGLHRPQRVSRYEPGTELEYDVTAVIGGGEAKLRIVIEKFVGGGFAGQVYKVKVLGIDGLIDGVVIGDSYAIKILIPPSGFSCLFRNVLYWIGFQGPFQLQVNPTASRAGALWQKFIRRAAKLHFGTEDAVVDIYGTFVDDGLGSCGEISQWIEGRTWQLEVDDRLDALKLWQKGGQVDTDKLGSAEYRAKHAFMRDFVTMLGDMGAHEFARQYEWSTCKSQPNCLKLRTTEDDPNSGLVAVDFRAGLVLLAVLPMSPGDFKLIAKGLSRGSLVQFDRGDIKKLEAFIAANEDEFVDMAGAVEQLKAAEDIYRNSLPDITHNLFKLFYSKKLWSTIFESAITGWSVRNLVGEKWQHKLRANKFLTFIFFLLGAIPFLGRLIRKLWARDDWRRHYRSILSSGGYLRRAISGKVIEKTIIWHRAGRIDSEKAAKVSQSLGRFLYHLPLSILPAGLHRFLTDAKFAKEKFAYIFIRPAKLYFSNEFREKWMRDIISEGRKKHILSEEDASTVLDQLNEPYIQKYLKSLAVHVCTLPVTQIVSVTIAAIYWLMHRHEANAWAVGLGIIGIFQIIPISPGSICRGSYTLYMAVKDRSFKNYNIAVFLSFFKYIGYLAFPIQMSYHYPVLARFMAGHWATEAVHIVPVFGERGALLEHWVFCLFYNWPLTLRRRMISRAKLRSELKPRYWHIALCAVIGSLVLGAVDVVWFRSILQMPGLKDIWPATIVMPLVCGAVITLAAGGAVLWKRFVASTVGGVLLGAAYTAVSVMIAYDGGLSEVSIASLLIWRVFVFAILATLGAIVAELRLPDPQLK